MAASTPTYIANLSLVDYPLFNTAYSALKVPDYYKDTLYKYGRENLSGFLDMFGTTTYRSDITYFHEEKDRLTPTIIANAAASGAAGAPVVITLAAASHVLGGTRSPIQPQFKVFFKDGGIGTVTAKSEAVNNAHTITVAPDLSSYAISVAASEQIAVMAFNAVGENNTQQQSTLDIPGTIYSNTMQIFRSDFKVTGTMLASFMGKMLLTHGIDKRTGQVTECWYNEDLGNYYQRFLNAREFYYMTGRQVTNTANLAAATYGGGFNGLLTSIEAGGNVLNYAAGMGFSQNDLQTMTIRMDKENSPKEYFVKAGLPLYQMIQSNIKDYFPNGAISYGAFGGNQASAIEWGFSSIAFSGYTFHLGQMPLFTNPTMMGVQGSKFPYYGLFIPATKTPDALGNETTYIQKTHLEGCGYERLFEEFVTGGASWLPDAYRTDNSDTVTWTWREQFGLEVFLPNHFYYVKQA